MKRLFATAAVLVAAALTLVACAGHNQHYYDDHVGWITLIDGTRASLDNWYQVGEANWRFEYGNVVADKRASKITPVLVSKTSYADFHLRAEVWASPDANSGIYFRITDPKKVSTAAAYEANIYDTAPNPSFGTGSLVGVATVYPFHKAGGRWNVMEITARGNRLTVRLNGILTVDTVNNNFKSGPIGLQYGQGIMKWRKVQIKPIV